jgi:hypothetical protein
MQRESTARAAEGADPAAGARNPGECTFNFCALPEDGFTFDRGAFTRSPRALAALSAASGQSPRALGGFSVQALASSGARSTMSPSGETPPGRRQVGMNKRLRVRREEASARRGSYWAASEANYPPIGGRQGGVGGSVHANSS